MSISTPNYSKHVNVYDPAEDTFLLLDALESDLELLKSISNPICLEIGSGSGCVITFLACMLNTNNALYYCTDINPDANACSKRTGLMNNISLEIIRTDLIHGFRGLVDVLIFNPPYVVTTSEEVGTQSIEASWAGGIDGREVVDRLLPMLSGILSDNGVFYLVCVKENKPTDIINILNGEGFKCDLVKSRKAGIEGLSILRFSRI